MLRIYLTGELCLTTPGRLVWARRLPGRQGRLAFAYLLAERSRPVPRHELANVLWPQRLPAAYDIALSAIVSKLRGLLHELGVGRRALTTASGCYQLQLPADSWVDVEAAKESVHLAESSLRAADPRSAYGHAVVACAVLRRPLLPEAEGGWIETYRYGFRNLRLRALDCLSQIHAWNGEHALALRAGEEAVELEPYRETGYRRLMLLHDRAGNSAEALRVYERLRALLASELNTRPGAEIYLLFQTIANKVELARKP
jgi:DNA-binding SARP family transcriptional activator